MQEGERGGWCNDRKENRRRYTAVTFITLLALHHERPRGLWQNAGISRRRLCPEYAACQTDTWPISMPQALARFMCFYVRVGWSVPWIETRLTSFLFRERVFGGSVSRLAKFVFFFFGNDKTAGSAWDVSTRTVVTAKVIKLNFPLFLFCGQVFWRGRVLRKYDVFVLWYCEKNV